jgi:glycosyltransferase involved in cell wall biosynthesis
MTVSVIIPTYNRPDLLKETLESVWNQSVLPDEILIGDDSQNDVTANLIQEELMAISPVPIRYFHHTPSLKEAKNVDYLYQNAFGDLLLHLHDDDPVYPRCIEYLKRAFDENPEIIASFGLQRMINEDGSLTDNAEGVNIAYFRTPDRTGIVDSLIAGAVSMFPNNGFLVKREAALSIGYSDMGRAGKAVDFYFGFRLGQLHKPFYFVNEYTAMCRITKISESRTSGADNGYRTVRILFEDLTPNQLSIPEIDKSIKFRMPFSIPFAAKIDKRIAIKWYFSRYHRKKILTLGGIRRFLLIVNPFR